MTSADETGIDIEITFKGHTAGAGIPLTETMSDQALFDKLRLEVNKALDFYEELHVASD